MLAEYKLEISAAIIDRETDIILGFRELTPHNAEYGAAHHNSAKKQATRHVNHLLNTAHPNQKAKWKGWVSGYLNKDKSQWKDQAITDCEYTVYNEAKIGSKIAFIYTEQQIYQYQMVLKQRSIIYEPDELKQTEIAH